MEPREVRETTFYLTIYRNTAIIQTGHSNAESTEDKGLQTNQQQTDTVIILNIEKVVRKSIMGCIEGIVNGNVNI